MSVPTGAVSGVVKLQQGGLWSNAVAFRVPAPAGSAAVLSPSALSMVVGETRSLQALDDDGELVTGAMWASSDPNVVSLSTADPPVLTAVAPGTATITVGGASSEVTVYAGPSLPLGTVIWTNGASTAGGLYPAVPNYDAVADVFARGADDEVTAITADGSTAWVRQGFSIRELYPDFQGGAIVEDDDKSLWRLHPLTGEPLHLFSYTSPEALTYGQGTPRIHPDGTVFVTDYACTSTDCYDGTDSETGAWVVGINSATGVTKFRVKLQNSTDVTNTTPADELFCQFTGGTITQHAWVDYPWSAIIAGDGFYYLPYRRYQATGSRHRSAAQVYGDAVYDLWDQLATQIVDSQFAAALATHAAFVAARGDSYTGWDSQLDSALNNGAAGRTAALNLLNLHVEKYRRLCDSQYTWTEQLRVMRVASDGAFTDINVTSWATNHASTYNLVAPSPLTPWGYRESVTHAGVDYATVYDVSLITDSDQGALIGWIADERCPGEYPPDVLVLTNVCTPATDEHLTLLTNGAIASDIVWGHDWQNPLRLELQTEDGSFVGTKYASSETIVLNAYGEVRWRAAGVTPIAAIRGGGVLAASVGYSESTMEFDSAGSVVGNMTTPSYYHSWTPHALSDLSGVVTMSLSETPSWAISAAAMYGGNPSQNRTAIPVIGFLQNRLLMGRQSSSQGCAVPPGDGTPAGLSTADQAVYDALRLALRTSGRLNTGSACQIAFDDPFDPSASLRAGDFTKLDPALQNQHAYDGPRSTLSVFKAGMMPPSSAAFPLAVRAAKNTAVCAHFVTSRGEVRPTRAAAQGWPYPGSSAPPTDIYLNTAPKVFPLIDQGTILHETLHNVAGLEDYVAPPKVGQRPLDLKQYIGIPSTTGATTIDITIRLRSMSCVP